MEDVYHNSVRTDTLNKENNEKWFTWVEACFLLLIPIAVFGFIHVKNKLGKKKIESANLHINGICNYSCGFCFSKNLGNEIMTPLQWEPILRDLWKRGVTKINFAGGEPTLHPQIIELCELAKSIGFTVSIVTNGSKIDNELMKKMKGFVDWIGLSIDSTDNEVEKAVGRQCKGMSHIDNVIEVADMAHDHGIRVKLNITVIHQSHKQNFSGLIRRINPERVKAFQVTKVEGENEDKYDEYSLTKEEWNYFKRNHENILLSNEEKIVFESADDMIDSYLMLNPMGMIMKNTNHKQSFVPYDIIKIDGFTSVVDATKYHRRGAVFKWGSPV